jgi:lipoyl(octanoyl) transferase
LNVNTDLEFFGLIVPCGIADRGVTSLQAQTGAAVAIDRVEASVTERFAEIFSREVVSHPAGVMS